MKTPLNDTNDDGDDDEDFNYMAAAAEEENEVCSKFVITCYLNILIYYFKLDLELT